MAWTHESDLTYHNAPFDFLLAAGDRPSQIVDKHRRVVATVEPLWEALGDEMARQLNLRAEYRRKYEENHTSDLHRPVMVVPKDPREPIRDVCCRCGYYCSKLEAA